MDDLAVSPFGRVLILIRRHVQSILRIPLPRVLSSKDCRGNHKRILAGWSAEEGMAEPFLASDSDASPSGRCRLPAPGR